MENHNITLNELARMIQGEFTAVRDEVRTGFEAVHEEFGTVYSILKRHDDEFVRVHEEMETGFSRVALILKSIQEDMRRVKEMEIEMVDLRNRVERLEARLGIA